MENDITYSVREFRAKLKQAFDIADKGFRVHIKKGESVYTLVKRPVGVHNRVHNEPEFHLRVHSGETAVATKIIKTPQQAKETVESAGYITKSFSARRKG